MIITQVRTTSPLFDKKIVVTRNIQQGKDFSGHLRRLGATVIHCPAIQIVPLLKTSPARAVKQLIRQDPCHYDWIIFLSANAVLQFSNLMKNDRSLIRRISIFAVGSKTSEAVQKAGWPVKKMAKIFNSTGVLWGLGRIRGYNILVPRVEGGPEDIVQQMKRRGANVDVLEIYRTVSAPKPTAFLRKKILAGVDAVTFTSPSTVRFFMEFFNSRERQRIFNNAPAFSIGPSTTQELRRWNIKRIVESHESTTEHLARALFENLIEKSI